MIESETGQLFLFSVFLLKLLLEKGVRVFS
jgi:hypothetical protein